MTRDTFKAKGTPPCKACEDEVVCLECGQPMMPMGQVCQACLHPADDPAEAQASGGGEVVAEVCEDQSGKYMCWSPGLKPLPPAGTKLYTAPPSAPVGVEDMHDDLPTPDLLAEAERIAANQYKDGRYLAARVLRIMCHRLAQQPAAIPRLANCGKYTATDNNGQHYYLNHANTWQTFQGHQPAAVDELIEAAKCVVEDHTDYAARIRLRAALASPQYNIDVEDND